MITQDFLSRFQACSCKQRILLYPWAQPEPTYCTLYNDNLRKLIYNPFSLQILQRRAGKTIAAIPQITGSMAPNKKKSRRLKDVLTTEETAPRSAKPIARLKARDRNTATTVYIKGLESECCRSISYTGNTEPLRRTPKNLLCFSQRHADAAVACLHLANLLRRLRCDTPPPCPTAAQLAKPKMFGVSHGAWAPDFEADYQPNRPRSQLRTIASGDLGCQADTKLSQKSFLSYR